VTNRQTHITESWLTICRTLCFAKQCSVLLLLLLHPFNCLFSGQPGVSRYQKGKTSLDLNEARDDVSCSSKIQIGFTFLVPAHLGSPGQRAVKRMYVRDDGVLGCSDISWTVCKQSAPHSRRITTTTPHHSIFTGQMLFLAPSRQCQSTEGSSTEDINAV